MVKTIQGTSFKVNPVNLNIKRKGHLLNMLANARENLTCEKKPQKSFHFEDTESVCNDAEKITCQMKVKKKICTFLLVLHMYFLLLILVQW